MGSGSIMGYDDYYDGEFPSIKSIQKKKKEKARKRALGSPPGPLGTGQGVVGQVDPIEQEAAEERGAELQRQRRKQKEAEVETLPSATKEAPSTPPSVAKPEPKGPLGQIVREAVEAAAEKLYLSRTNPQTPEGAAHYNKQLGLPEGSTYDQFSIPQMAPIHGMINSGTVKPTLPTDYIPQHAMAGLRGDERAEFMTANRDAFGRSAQYDKEMANWQANGQPQYGTLPNNGGNGMVYIDDKNQTYQTPGSYHRATVPEHSPDGRTQSFGVNLLPPQMAGSLAASSIDQAGQDRRQNSVNATSVSTAGAGKQTSSERAQLAREKDERSARKAIVEGELYSVPEGATFEQRERAINEQMRLMGYGQGGGQSGTQISKDKIASIMSGKFSPKIGDYMIGADGSIVYWNGKEFVSQEGQ